MVTKVMFSTNSSDASGLRYQGGGRIGPPPVHDWPKKTSVLIGLRCQFSYVILFDGMKRKLVAFRIKITKISGSLTYWTKSTDSLELRHRPVVLPQIMVVMPCQFCRYIKMWFSHNHCQAFEKLIEKCMLKKQHYGKIRIWGEGFFTL